MGEENYARLVDLVNRAKLLFEADPEDVTGQADEGHRLLLEMDDVITAARPTRPKGKTDADA